MAIRVQNLPKKNIDESSVHSLSHLSVSCPPWWNSNEQQIAQTLPQNITLKVETPSQLYHNAKHLGLQLPDQESSSAQAIGQSHHEVGVIGVTNSQCNSSESGQDESCGKDIEGQMKPVFLLNNPNTVFSPSHPNYNHSMAYARNPYADAYFGGLFTPYGQQAIIQPQVAGSAPTRIPLPLDLDEDGPIYVNAKQYHGILRRRQYRAKLEAQNKLVKARKPYLHESRHLHALNRVRGSGGRFLPTKKLQQCDPTFNTSSHCISDTSCSDQKNSRSEFESRCSHTAEYVGSSTSCSDITSVSNSDGNFQQPEHRFSDISPHVGSHMRNSGSMCNGIQHCASIVR
ncbi:PREDICTED: nuclear transcription factor Y subunit A-3 [Theobroma cacao]|uniref:Nuclear transcription factor Y subunit n=3 Tax=Theobroma cacao TaxID=3641 RepID=A0A061GLP6_THECC|nr:PREDICTED: nuclear transcription factor Y subunit A-3 [Theobroma cacao]XP_007012705.1 PREDICTED: nuclear transcription factor Y subunit A-3 [Theobroma cacao]EOY30322.1 Nuclear transcription factor Y subunit A-3, putative isoform 1 [Theobroma cacao]EOY30323.1 Nuclear transcription factor Y subunit A-3, putative isoform 1 [Theobroma cacao]EOY30324.1 Nuclear transcription factor Y subunit A-3, putative isoform 1 [Theobroma cacao]